MIKRILLILYFLFICTTVYAQPPKFKLHIIKDMNVGVNYSINYPVVIDYDNDGDQDILIMSKEGTLYFLENLLI